MLHHPSYNSTKLFLASERQLDLDDNTNHNPTLNHTSKFMQQRQSHDKTKQTEIATRNAINEKKAVKDVGDDERYV